MKANILNGIISIGVPDTFVFNDKTYLNYRNIGEKILEEHGWKDLIIPVIDSRKQKLGELVLDKSRNIYTYIVLDKSDVEIQLELITEAKHRQNTLIEEKIKEKFLKEMQLNSNDEYALINSGVFPIWEVGIDAEVNDKYLSFDDKKELVLFKCLQKHKTQSNWAPKDTHALWVRISVGKTLVWVQPKGAHDAYKMNDSVYYPDKNGNIYISTIDNNVWSPIDYGWVKEQ